MKKKTDDSSFVRLKVTRIMKITTFLLLISILQVSASTYAQNQRVSVAVENGTLYDVISQIENGSDYMFFYNSDEIDNNRKISFRAEDKPISEILGEMFRNNGLTYKVSGKHIIITKTGQASQQPNRQISGTIKDTKGEFIIGASVAVKGTTIGAISNMDGKFTLSIPEGVKTVTISYIGMKTVELNIERKTFFDVILEDDSVVMSEIVVTALGIKKEAKSLSYHVQQLNADEVTKVPDANFINSLSGKVAGVTINTSSAGTGSASRVVMRGTKSLFGNNTALYVIDGVPMLNIAQGEVSDRFEGAGQSGDALASINPDDIESISVLSGPSAAALYGSSAANGVVMVTTKKGLEGRTSINYSNSTMFSAPLIMPEFQNTYGQSSIGDFQSWGDKLAVASSYAPEDFFQTGYSVTNSLNVSTGTNRNQTYVSLGNVTSEGIIRNNDYDRINFSLRNTTKFFNDKLTLDVHYSLSKITEKNMVAQGEYHNPIVAVYLFPPGDDFSKIKAFERYDASRNFPVQYWGYDDGLGLQNPYWVTDREKFQNKKQRYMTTASLKYDFGQGINLSGRFKLDESTEKPTKKFNASTNPLFASDAGYYALNHIETRQMYGEALLNVDKYFFDNTVNLIANAGASVDDIRYDQDMYGGKLASVPNLFTYSNVAQSTAESSQSGYRTQKQSVFASAQIGYQSMAYLDLTARNDWPSTLAGTKHSSFFYYSLGLSGIITDIFKIKTWAMPYMKLRASYSEVGNEPTHHITISTYQGAKGLPPVTHTGFRNPNLEPERTKSWELGANFGLLGNKLKVDATLYKSSTYNQYFNVPLSASSGYSSIYINGGRVDNKGLELSARYTDRWGKFGWSSYLTYSLNRNKIVELISSDTKNPVTGGAIELPDFDMVGTGNYKIKLKEGGTMSDVYVTTLRTDEHGAVFVDPVSQSVIAETNNFVYAGSAAPKYNLSWGNTFDWNGISLGFLVSARVGGIVVSNTQAYLDYYGVSKTSANARDVGGALVNGYRIPAKEYYQTAATPNGGAASMYVYSATNVRLSELTLGYDVPVSRWTNVIKGLNVAFIGRNLFFFYNKAPFDPEVTASTGTYFQGIDYFMQPSLRNLGFSVKLQF